MMRCRAAGMLASIVIGGLIANMPASAESGYRPISPTMLDKTITLTGHDLTIEQLVDVARNGAKVQLSAEAKQRQADNYGLLLEAAAEGIAVYWFNRGAGDQRETIMFSGDPLTPKNKAVSGEKSAAGIPVGRDRRLRTGGRGRGNRARDDGRSRQCHDLQRAQPATLADADRSAEPPHHAGGAVARHARRRRSGSTQQCGGDDGGCGRCLLSGHAHAGRRGAGKGGPEADPTVCRRRQCTDEQRCVRHRHCGARRQRCASARWNGPISSTRWI